MSKSTLNLVMNVCVYVASKHSDAKEKLAMCFVSLAPEIPSIVHII